MHDIPWNRIILREFEELAILTEEEVLILHDWIAGKSVVESSMKHNMSTRKVDTLRSRIRAKYDAVQPFSQHLPLRNK